MIVVPLESRGRIATEPLFDGRSLDALEVTIVPALIIVIALLAAVGRRSRADVQLPQA